MDSLSVATISMTSTADKELNLKTAERHVADAAALGADWVVLPEMLSYIGPYERLVEVAEPADGPLSERFASWAQRYKITLFAGSVPERAEAGSPAASAGKVYNTMYAFRPDGRLLSKYRKTHLFHLRDEAGEALYCETAGFVAGDELVRFEHDAWQVGCAICYDLRFADFFSALARPQPLDILIVPAAFTYATGERHWQLLLSARAIELQCYIVAANQTGTHAPGKISWGHSMLVDPWGQVLASTGAERGIAQAMLSQEKMATYRRRLPVLANRRPELYR